MTKPQAQPLLIAESFAEVTKLTEAMYDNRLPGFQVRPDLLLAEAGCIVELIDAVDHAAQTSNNGSGVLLDRYTNLEIHRGGIAAHVDTSYMGPAIHYNYEGTGAVLLRSVLPSEMSKIEDRGAVRLQHEDYFLKHPDQWSRGALFPGSITIFSEGGVGSMYTTLHNFIRYEAGEFARIASLKRPADDLRDRLGLDIERDATRRRAEITHGQYLRNGTWAAKTEELKKPADLVLPHEA